MFLSHVGPASRTMLDFYLTEERHKKISDGQTADAKNLIMNRLRTLRDKELKDHPEFADKVISIEVCEGFPPRKFLAKRKS